MTERPSLDEVRRCWSALIEVAADVDTRVAALARNGMPAAVDGDTLVLEFKYRVHAGMLERDQEPLRHALAGEFGGVWRIRCEAPERPAGDDLADVDSGELAFMLPIVFPAGLFERIEAEAVARGVEPAELVRTLVEDALGR